MAFIKLYIEKKKISFKFQIYNYDTLIKKDKAHSLRETAFQKCSFKKVFLKNR